VGFALSKYSFEPLRCRLLSQGRGYEAAGISRRVLRRGGDAACGTRAAGDASRRLLGLGSQASGAHMISPTLLAHADEVIE